MGYKVTFDTGQEVEFETEPTQADIDEVYSSFKPTKPTQRVTAPIPESPIQTPQDIVTRLGNKDWAAASERINPQNLYDTAVGKVQDVLGYEQESKNRLAKVEERVQAGKDQGILDKAKGVGLGIADVAIGGTLGMLGGIGSGLLHGAVEGSPAYGLKKAKETLHSLTPSVFLGIDYEQNPSYEAIMAPFAAMSEGFELAGKGYGEIAGVLGASDNFKKELSASVEGSLLVGTFGVGAKKAYKEWKDNVPTTERKITEATPREDIEKALLKETLKHLIAERDKMVKFQQELEAMIAEGHTDKQVVDLSQRLQEQIQKTESDITRFEYDTTGKNPPPEVVKEIYGDIQDIQEQIDVKTKKIQEIDTSRSDGSLTKPQFELRKKLTKELEALTKREQAHPDFGKERVPLKELPPKEDPLTVDQDTALKDLEGPTLPPEEVKPVEPIPTPMEPPVESLRPLEEPVKSLEETPGEFVGPEVPSQAILDFIAPWTPKIYIENVIPKQKNRSLVLEWVSEVLNNFKENKTTPRQADLTKRVIESLGKDFVIKELTTLSEYVKDPDAFRNKLHAERMDMENQYGELSREVAAGKDGSYINPSDTKGARLKSGSSELIRSNQKEIDAVEKKIRDLKQQLVDNEQGLLPSGSLDPGRIEQQLKKLYSQHEKLTNVRQDGVINARKETSFDSSLPSIDPAFMEEQIKRNSLISSVEEILNTQEVGRVNLFTQHPELFTTILGSKIHIDKKILEQDKYLEGTIEAFIKDLGLDNDQIYIVPKDPFSENKNEIKFSGNTGVIHFDLANHAALRDKFKENPKNAAILKGLGPEAHRHFLSAKILAHELGHFILVKWLKEQNVTKENFTKLVDDLNLWLTKNRVEAFSIQGLSKPELYAKYHESLQEYFAERVSKYLISDGSLTNRFSSAKGNSLGVQIKKLVSNVMAWLKTKGINIDRKYVHDDLIHNIIEKNKESVKRKSEEFFNELEQNMIDKAILQNSPQYPFANKTLDEVDRTEVLDSNGNIINWHLDETNAKPNFSTAALNVIGAPGKLAKEMGHGYKFITKGFGKTTLSNILRNHALVRKTERSIREAELTAATIGNKLWYGDVLKSQWEAERFLSKFSKIKNPDSPYAVVKALTDTESHRLQLVFKEGFENSFDYAKTLSTLGTHLTPKEQHAFNVLSKMFERQYDETVKLQLGLGKKHVMAKRTGWYPAVRRGQYSVAIHYGKSQAKVYQQHFGSKAAADSFRKEAEALSLQHFDIGEVIDTKDVNVTNPDLMRTIDMVEDTVLGNQSFLLHNTTIEAVEKLKERLLQRGGKLGQHHQFRTNIGGSKGDQFFKSAEELGAGFKEGIQDSAQEYTSGLRNMILKTRTELMLEKAKGDDPIAIMASRQMLDSALGRVPNKLEGFDQAIRNTVDAVARSIVESFGGNYIKENPLANSIQSAVLSTFYLFKVLPKISLFIIQLLSPIQAVRHMAYDGGLRATKSFGKGLYKLMSGDAELYDSLYRVSQRSNIIEPQFMEALGLQAGQKKTIVGITTEFIKDWLLLKKPTEFSDIMSRAITYSMMYTHYRDLGLSVKNAERRAMHGTDSTMAAYSSGETAPVFKNLGGFIGESMRPLQTYGQTQVGNFIADYNHFKGKDPKTWAPMMVYGITATIMGGAATGMIISQYEAIRNLLLMTAPSYAPPSPLDIIRSMPDFLDGVVEDPDAQEKLLAYGVPSMSGMDIGSSARISESLPSNLLTVISAMVEGKNEAMKLFPATNNAMNMVGGAATLSKKALGGNVTDNEMRTALTGVLPSGTIGWGAKELAGVNTTKVLGQNTNNIAVGKEQEAMMPRGSMELFSNVLGSKSTNERFQLDKNLQDSKEDYIRNQKKKKTIDLWRDTGDIKYIEKLIVDFGMTETQINTALQTQVWKAFVPKHLRTIMDQNGNITSQENQRKAKRLFRFGTP